MNAVAGAGPPAPARPPAPGVAAISVRKLNKFYGGFQALRDIDLEVAQGEIVVLCGPSGSGKSSLIRCIAHLERHDSGAVHVNGMELTRKAADIARARSQLGMVFQSFNLFPHMSALANCAFAPRHALRMPAARAEAVARSQLARVKVEDQADKYPSELSGGQQQRVAIARALCLEPSIMLFDEPTSALDPESVGSVLRVMEDLAASGITMVCVTHEMGFARRVAHRCVFMDKGEIIEQGPSARFFAEPATARLRDFLRRTH